VGGSQENQCICLGDNSRPGLSRRSRARWGFWGGASWLSLGGVRRGSWPPSHRPAEALRVPALLREAGGCRTAQVWRLLLLDPRRVAAFGSCEGFWRLGSRRRAGVGLEDEQPMFRLPPTLALERELLGWMLQPELKTLAASVAPVLEYDLKEAV